ncbi:hypothetical protein G5B00_13185 [Parapedobacter sp. SGR-10]|uniref:hypothetical protein n=1 Tax=Parapedobacter sp. SGR-10 TaxID=2710879 RepID=UPI0013D8D180|nr:hypothetical protein [Parapedobacter sp. SGR-10]NGF57465.1 hypothetical protein [Parapedobacter sp. SGR-10]
MKRFLILLMTLGIVLACEKSEPSNQEADRERLDMMKREILDRIDAVPCENPEDWQVEALGSKPCGGPWGYVPYPHVADESGELLALIKEYNQSEAEYNEKYNITSDCRAEPKPTGVRCVDGKAELYTMALN